MLAEDDDLAMLPVPRPTLCQHRTVFYNEVKPCPALVGVVKLYWSLHGEGSVDAPDRVLPDGCVELVFHYGDRFARRLIPGGKKCDVPQPRAIACGQFEHFIDLVPQGRIGTFAIRLEAAGARVLLGRACSDLTGHIVALEELGGWAHELALELLGARTDLERVRLADNILSRRRSSFADELGLSEVRTAVRLLEQSKGSYRVDELVARSGWSERTLRRRFNEWIGLPPKRLARLLRFHDAVCRLDRGSSRSGAALALESGYYDQAHLVRDFRAIAGLPPGAFEREPLELARYLLGSS